MREMMDHLPRRRSSQGRQGEDEMDEVLSVDDP